MSRCSQRKSLSAAIPLGTSTKEQILKEQITDFCDLVAVVSCPRMTDTIVVFSVWASNMLKMRSWMTHAPVVGCMSMTLLRSRLSFLKRLAPSAATHADFSGSSRKPPAGALGDLRVTVRASPPGTSPRTSYSSCSERPIRFLGDFAGPSHGTPRISFGAPSEDRMSIAASGDGLTSSEDEGAVGATPSGVVTTAAPDQSWRPCLPGQPWVSGWRSTDRPVPNPRGWMIGYSERGMAHNRVLLRCLFPGGAWGADEVVDGPFHGQKPLVHLLHPHYSLMAGLPGGTRGTLQVERAITVHLCPRNAATWRNRLRLPSKACKLTSTLPKAYSAAGQAGLYPARHGYPAGSQAKAIKQVHESSTDPGVEWQELRTATDFALTSDESHSAVPREGEVAHQGGPGAPSLAQPGWDEGRRQGTLHLKPPSPRQGSSATLSRGFAQELSAVQQQTEKMARTAPLLPRRRAGRRILCLFCFCAHFLKEEEQFLFLWVLRSMGRQCGIALLSSLSRPQPILPAAKRAAVQGQVPPHTPLASPVGTQGVRWGCLRMHCLLYHPALLPFAAPPQVHWYVPLEPLARRLECRLKLPSPSRWLHAHRFDSATRSVHQATSQVQRR